MRRVGARLAGVAGCPARSASALPANVTPARPSGILRRAAPQLGETLAARAAGVIRCAIAIQLFTSGTTGTPKAAVLRHENIMAYVLGSVEFGAAREEEAALVAVPPYHIAGISRSLSSTYCGRRIVMLPSFEPRRSGCASWRRKKITHAFRRAHHAGAHHGTTSRNSPGRQASRRCGRSPTGVARCRSRSSSVLCGRFRAWTSPTPTDLPLETSATVCLLSPDDHRAAAASDDPQVRRRHGSVGKPLPAVQVASPRRVRRGPRATSSQA